MTVPLIRYTLGLGSGFVPWARWDSLAVFGCLYSETRKQKRFSAAELAYIREDDRKKIR